MSGGSGTPWVRLEEGRLRVPDATTVDSLKEEVWNGTPDSSRAGRVLRGRVLLMERVIKKRGYCRGTRDAGQGIPSRKKPPYRPCACGWLWWWQVVRGRGAVGLLGGLWGRCPGKPSANGCVAS